MPDPNLHAELALAGRHHLIRTAQPAGRGRADLQEMPAHRLQIEHRVEGRDLVDPDPRHVEHVGDHVHRGARQPIVVLTLRQV